MKKVTLIILFFAVIIACGSKGDLVLEPESIPIKISDFNVSQLGVDMVLSFTFPNKLSDNKALEKNSISKVYIYYSKTIIPDNKFRKKSSLLLKIKEPSKLIEEKEGQSIIKISFKLNDLNKTEHYFGIIYYIKKKRSPLSVIRSINSIVPYKAIDNVGLEHERKMTVLKWKKPEFDVLKNKVSQIAGFNVYRKIELDEIEDKEDKNLKNGEINKAKPTFKKINTALIKKEFIEDTDVSADGKYYYKVSTVYNKNIESSHSKIASIIVKDIYPPDIPENLFVFKGDGFMLLNWEEVKEKDFSHYTIYRKRSRKGRFKEISNNITKSRYKDKNIKKGILYFYYIIAVDKKGNESEPSKIVKERY